MNEHPDVPEESKLDALARVVPAENWDSIQYWQKEIMRWAESKGWNQGLNERSFGDWTTLLHTEISEAYEDFRDGHGYTEVYYELKSTPGQKYTYAQAQKILRNWSSDQSPREEERPHFKPCGIPIEIADLLIRAFHLAEFFNFDLTQMIADKMAYNEKRPFRHGDKRV